MLLAGCASTQSNAPKLTPFPPTPSFPVVGKDPVKSANDDGTYTVSKELVEWATKAKLWTPRVLQWKQENEIP